MNSLSNIQTWIELPVFLTKVPGRMRDLFWGSHCPLVSGNPHGAPHLHTPGNLLVLLRQLPPTAPCSGSQGCFTLHCLSWAPASGSHLRFLLHIVFPVSRLLFNLQPCQVPSLYCCHSSPLLSMMLCLLNLQTPSFSSVFLSSQRGPTIELLGLQEYTSSDFSLCRILLRAGLRRCHHLFPESTFSFSYLTLVRSYLTHGIRDLSMLFFIITHGVCVFSHLKLSSILPPSFLISPIIPRPPPWRICSFSRGGGYWRHPVNENSYYLLNIYWAYTLNILIYYFINSQHT